MNSFCLANTVAAPLNVASLSPTELSGVPLRSAEGWCTVQVVGDAITFGGDFSKSGEIGTCNDPWTFYKLKTQPDAHYISVSVCMSINLSNSHKLNTRGCRTLTVDKLLSL